ncbi:MAG TPA: lipid-A-disaccharide synthase [Bradyrhizobium sp.]|nr:lipid-A-disaccharide synthase [Bradyrhizobium sp.]
MTTTRPEAIIPTRIFLVATEESGDRLGAGLMKILRQRLGDAVRFEGVGGLTMAREGLVSLFPIEELSIMGFTAVGRKLPMILRRIRETADAAIAAAPDIMVIVDSPDFTHRVARRVRARAPAIPVVDYVAPTVWAWRPGRARAMRRYVDHVLALLPFEPEAYRRLGGPPCTYIGHTLIEQIGALRPNPEEQKRRDGQPPVLVVLPGSRRSEIRHHMAVFGETLRLLREQGTAFEPVLPTMPHLLDAVHEGIASWPVQPRIAVGEDAKKAAFRMARAAFAKSGTVTLELALAGVPMIGAYRAGPVEMWIALTLARTPSVILANLVIGENVVPEFMQRDAAPEKLVPALRNVLEDTPQRQRQLDAFARLDAIMATGGQPPSVRAADIVLETLQKARRSP